jgi:hypothetical protein
MTASSIPPLRSFSRIVARTSVVACMVAASLALNVPDALAQGKKSSTFNVVPITITSVTQGATGLVANGVVGSNAFSVPITLTPLTAGTATSCPVLDLHVGAIHLSLLGLNVDTSAICLKLTAQPGGGLLGDLLCNIGNLLNSGLNIDQVLATLTSTQLQTLNNGLTSLLNTAVFQPLTQNTALAGASCSILHLALGPVDLTLLGLNVHLDNCDNGPVTVDITATPSGGLLGSLLCGLANVLNGGGSGTGVLAVLGNIARVIGQLVG